MSVLLLVTIAGTTLGRIGVGYVYADWYPQITWTTPGLGPIGAKIGIFQATPLQSSTGADATNTKYPRVEAQLDYSVELGDLGAYVWVDGQYQNLQRTRAEAQLFHTRNKQVLVLILVSLQLLQPVIKLKALMLVVLVSVRD